MRAAFASALALAAIAAFAPAARAADAERGRQLNAANCQQCHDDGLYRGPARKARSIAEIAAQVRKGEQALGLGWSDQDVADVTEYLNKGFYRLAR
ncbi:MAG: Cytochrome c6 [Gammaproteobacteria bacterium]|nr:Cytochrome c6 [Gammaproteobacteria bacterium]